MNQHAEYPQYRKYRNGKSYFCILSSTLFEEIQILGARYFFHVFEVKILPDRNLIHDMTFDYETNWEKITAEEYGLVKERVE